MKDIHNHLSKLRSDAAECLVLSSLAPDGKGAMFTRVAEHLNALASDLEKSATAQSNGFSGHKAEADGVLDVAHPETSLRPHRTSVRLGFFGAAVFAVGALVGATSPGISEAQFWSSAVRNHEQHTSTGQAERSMVSEQVAALGERLNNFDKKLTTLEKTTTEIGRDAAIVSSEAKTFGARLDDFDHKLDGIATLLSTATVSPEAKEPAAEVSAAPLSGKSAATAESSAAFDEPPLQAKPPDVGPRGCTQFRSFDPKSGTYVTLDGRRRPCR